MITLKTDLMGRSNAILFEQGESGTINRVLGIIVCKGGKNVDISKVIKKAIAQHFVILEKTKITLDVEGVLTNQQSISFSAEWVEDGDDIIRDFEIFIAATY